MFGWVRRLLSRAPAITAITDSGTDTEFTAEVVRITEILPHPNADRLEIAKFELARSGPSTYEVVVGKSEFSVGDLAGYFSVDCIVPTDRPEFKFLAERLDGVGKSHYRLRAARLRKVFSQGLLVKPTIYGLVFGESLAKQMGVDYYRAPEPAEKNGPTQAKPRPQRWPIYGVDSLKKVPHLFEQEETVAVTEKIHGTNFRFGWIRRKVFGIPVGWRFVVGSHRTMKDGKASGYYETDVWTEAAKRMQLAYKTRDYRGYVFYGELYGYTYSGQKIQDLTYDGDRTDTKLAVFDIRTPRGQWLSIFDREVAAVDCDLPTVPLLYIGEYYTDLPLKLSEGMSTIAPKQIREGCVVESITGERRKAKYVGEGYLMRKGA